MPVLDSFLPCSKPICKVGNLSTVVEIAIVSLKIIIVNGRCRNTPILAGSDSPIPRTLRRQGRNWEQLTIEMDVVVLHCCLVQKKECLRILKSNTCTDSQIKYSASLKLSLLFRGRGPWDVYNTRSSGELTWLWNNKLEHVTASVPASRLWINILWVVWLQPSSYEWSIAQELTLLRPRIAKLQLQVPPWL